MNQNINYIKDHTLLGWRKILDSNFWVKVWGFKSYLESLMTFDSTS